MNKIIFGTGNNLSGSIARLFLGLVLFPHGAQKMLGWFGGYGFTGTMGFFTQTVHLPWIIGFMVIVIEFIGSLCLLLGIAGRWWALLIAINMIGIIFSSHIHVGFFMNWYGTQQGEGYEYHLLAIGLAAVVLAEGSGRFSVDKSLYKA